MKLFMMQRYEQLKGLVERNASSETLTAHTESYTIYFVLIAATKKLFWLFLKSRNNGEV